MPAAHLLLPCFIPWASHTRTYFGRAQARAALRQSRPLLACIRDNSRIGAMLHATQHNAHVTCQRFQQQLQRQQQQQQRHEAPARDLQALHSFLAHTDQSAAAAAGVGISCGCSCNNSRKALNVGYHSGGNFIAHTPHCPPQCGTPPDGRSIYRFGSLASSSSSSLWLTCLAPWSVLSEHKSFSC